MSTLNENQVVDAVCEYLKREGYAINSQCSTTQQGIDIVASKMGSSGRLLVEAKGGTSSKQGTARYDRGFNRTQTFDRVAKGFFTAACMIQAHNTDQVALAYPDAEWVRDYLGRIRTILLALRITVFLVKADLKVVVF